MSQGYTRDYLVKATGETKVNVNGVPTSVSSGTSFDITGIPTGVKLIHIGLSELDLSGVEHMVIQLGTSGGFVTSGYLGSSSRAASHEKNTGGFEVFVAGATENMNGVLTLMLMDEATDTWCMSYNVGSSDTIALTVHGGFSVPLSGALSQIRFKSESTDTFTAGTVNILYDNPNLAVSGIESVAAGVTDVFVNGVLQASTSGTEIDFTVPAGIREFKLALNDVGLSNSDQLQVQLGDSGGIETTGYKSTGSRVGSGVSTITSTTAFTSYIASGVGNFSEAVGGIWHFILQDAATNTWIGSHTLGGIDSTAITFIGGGVKSLSGELTTVRLTRSGTNTFGQGSVNIQYEAQDLDLGSGVISGGVVQVVNFQDGEYATASTVVPYNDTIPQNNEGTEFMTASITPTNAANKLRIDVVVNGTIDSAGQVMCVALFQDSIADALATGFTTVPSIDYPAMISFTHFMTAGTASSTTFKVRAGPHSAGNFDFNGAAGARKYGGVMASSITITEYKV